MSAEVRRIRDSVADQRWTPIHGSFAHKFLELKTEGQNAKLSRQQMEKVTAEASEILSHCASPSELEANTAVLVVGYVQSGKTLSFTTVAALARDNGFGIVIILAGTTRNLKKQSEDRLDVDLGLTELQSAWTRRQDPSVDDAADLRRILEGWKRKNAGLSTLRDKPALLLTVLKHAGRIRSAADALQKLGPLLSGVPVLIVDDESDQASLNTRARQNLISGSSGKSQTYDSITSLRSVLPNHSYLQYTATPQANLLLAISDVLNPSYVKVIDSGDAYTGGKYFFQQRIDELVVKLHPADICDPKAMPELAPESLQEALRFFLLGAADAARSEPRVNRSMMVQASQSTAPHGTYERWINDLLSSWAYLLRSGDEASVEIIRGEFRRCYESLKATTSAIAPLEDLLQWIPELYDEIQVLQVNSVGAEKVVNWKAFQFWILIGGLKLDRGFTVEGLTVTYMPRNLSENADVLQQRARFFGYRAEYAGFCRIYLPSASVKAFKDYVEDEEYLRETLRENGARPLNSWRRQFLLSKSIRSLTRSSISGRKMKRLTLDGGWVTPSDLELDREPNIKQFTEFSDDLQSRGPATIMGSAGDITDKRVDSPRNLLLQLVPADDVLKFLLGMEVSSDRDRILMTALTMALGDDHLGESGIDVVLMGGLTTRGQRGRTLQAVKDNIFVGQSPSSLRSTPLIYSGDRQFRSESRPTLQLRLIKVLDIAREPVTVPWFSLYIPGQFDSDFLVEEF